MDDADEFKLSRSSVVAGDAPTQAASEPSSTEVARAPLRGYQVGKLLGRGGMGEVVLARDERIGRDVAIKRMRGTRPGDVGVVRFLREARIQARLEHPAIVPVHELGEDVDHQPYFTMKRLSGITLAEQLALPAPPLRQKLLRAFVEVCRAVEFAHASGVVHRDLKPANVMLGDFGEVYVLDWGLARVVGEPEPLSVAAGVDSLAGETQPGAILGTPGYMSPEQVRGASDVGPASDVYALGAILFELLAGEPLHVRGSAVLRSSLGPTDGSASQRQPERAIPPELDSLCIAALASDRAARPSASELAERIERYLDGDRDLERRRELAATSIAEAHTALASDVVGGRARAMQAAGRALALDPESHDAAALVTRLMLEPATRLPPELEEELSASEARVQRRQSRVATLSFIASTARSVALFCDLAEPRLQLAFERRVRLVMRRELRTDGRHRDRGNRVPGSNDHCGVEVRAHGLSHSGQRWIAGRRDLVEQVEAWLHRSHHCIERIFIGRDLQRVEPHPGAAICCGDPRRDRGLRDRCVTRNRRDGRAR